MAKYTTEVRSICETMAGYVEQQGYGEIESIVKTSAPLIFDFDFPIFDEGYRLPLEEKILKHYYTREICEETVGLWKLRLNAKMNEIMPYYNQLYMSQLLEFNPFYDVDVTTTHTKDNVGTSAETSEGTSANVTVTDTDTTDEKQVLYAKDNDVYTETQEWLQHNKENTENVESANKSVYDRDDYTKATGTHYDATQDSRSIREETDKTNVVDRDDYTKATGTHYDATVDSRSTRVETVSIDTGDVVVDTSNKGSSSNTTTKDADNWSKYSDTPQGGLTGLTTNTYLTNAENDIADERGTSNTSTTDNGSQTTTNNLQNDTIQGTTYAGGITDEKTDSTDQTYEQDTTTTDYIIKGTVYSGGITDEKTDSTDQTYQQDSTTTDNGTKATVADEVYITDDRNTVSTQDNTESSENTTGAGTVDTTVTSNGNTTGNKNGNTTAQEDFEERVLGKRGTETYSSMLLKFRETFLNIDMMIINDLKSLFMLIW